MELEDIALAEWEGMPALPEFPQQAAPQENVTQQQEAASLETLIWIIEAPEDLDEAGVRHMNAFYVLLKEWFQEKDYTCTLFTKQKYNEILKFCLATINGADPRSLFIAGNKQAYKWVAKYDAIVIGEESYVLVLHPTSGPIADAQSTCLSALQKPTYVVHARRLVGFAARAATGIASAARITVMIKFECD